MKNKEIELILTKLKIISEEKENGAYICDREHSKLLLSYIEQLEKNRDKALKIIDSYELGKYDYSIPPGGIIELRDILKGDSDENIR